jgi:hypothetical protein
MRLKRLIVFMNTHKVEMRVQSGVVALFSFGLNNETKS